ncbi:MAG: RHS repeat-associated core domain-containing protein [Dehalococcoidia bacterium]|nr:MAG: RHS repeat-associated core domain-containing protein [Dehalococcoidia bacterium]
MTDTNGEPLGAILYRPFGETRGGSVPTDKLFTGQRLDDTGLYYYGARYYDPGIGRFISADPTVQDFSYAQTFNRYSYCLNNPLKYIDVSGYWVSRPCDMEAAWRLFAENMPLLAAIMLESDIEFRFRWDVPGGKTGSTEAKGTAGAIEYLDIKVEGGRRHLKDVAGTIAHEAMHAILRYIYSDLLDVRYGRLNMQGDSLIEEAFCTEIRNILHGIIGSGSDKRIGIGLDLTNFNEIMSADLGNELPDLFLAYAYYIELGMPLRPEDPLVIKMLIVLLEFAITGSIDVTQFNEDINEETLPLPPRWWELQ